MTGQSQTGFHALRRMARDTVSRAQERCDLCGEGLADEHRHLLELANRQILCACRACAILFGSSAAGGRARKLIPSRARFLTDFRMSDGEWADLRIPVNVAFFYRDAAAERITAIYPSPMGPTESLLPLEAWTDMEERNPVLREMEPDVEALLVYRVRSAREHFLVPIDECYKLVGLVRIYWKGLGGGSVVWQEIEQFFEALTQRAVPTAGNSVEKKSAGENDA